MIQDTAPSERIIIIRPSFKKMCANNACRAAVFNHMLYWIAYKHKNDEEYWYATGEDIHKQMDQSWGISIIRRETNALIAAGLIGGTHNPKWGADRTKYFFFGKDQAKVFFTTCTQEKVCPWCIGLPTIVLNLLTPHLLNLSNANDECVKCICQKHQMQLLNLVNGSDRSNKAITKESTKGSTKILSRETSKEIEDSLVAFADTESDGAATFLSQLDAFEETLEEVQQNGSANTDVARLVYPNDDPLHSNGNHRSKHQAQAAIDGQAPLDVSPHKRGGHSQEEPVVKSADTSLSSGSAHTSTPNDITSQEEALQGEIPTERALLPAVPGTPMKTPPTHKTVGKGKSKIPDPVPLCSPRTIREAIDAIRGYALEEVGAIIHQNKVLKEWCQKHTLEEYQHVIDHVTKGHCANKEHQFWREGSNFASFFNADKLAKLTPGILAELGHIPKPVAPPEVAVKEEKIIGWQPQRRITPPTGVTVIYG